VVLALFCISPTRTQSQKQSARPGCNSREGGRSVRDEQEIATGVSEARSRQHRGTKTPTFMTQAVRPMSMRLVLERRSAEAVFGRRETSGPPVMPYGA
jgi:hypothetical protein